MKSSIKGIAQYKYRIYPKRKPRWIQLTKTFSNWYFPKKEGIVTIISTNGYYNVVDRYICRKICGIDFEYQFVTGRLYR